MEEMVNFLWIIRVRVLRKEHVCWDIFYRTAEDMEKPLIAGDQFTVHCPRSA
uniref:Uncharacterized protein n=1 Tax=Nelumbo nucifera TaxID=4432 RepID=A0A822Z6F0_NELNU|nr:TPA_asm: hypothetical protein HUJ06_014740 [Nelumbo nucifera]